MKKQVTFTLPDLDYTRIWRFAQKWLLPNPGTLILMIVLLLTLPALAGSLHNLNAASISTIPYQGRLADASGNPLTSKQNMEFRLYNTPTGGTPLWEEFWTGANSVDVSDGLFSVMLGSINTGLTAVVQGNTTLYLGITVGTDSEMVPRVQLGSVPFSIWSLTVADNSVTSAKIADNAVGSSEIAANAVGSSEIADGAVTRDKAPGLIASANANTEVQYGQVIAQATDTTGWIFSVDIDFAPDFTSKPQVSLQPSWDSWPDVVATWGYPCNGTMCRVFLTRIDRSNWSNGQRQPVDWIAIGQR